jgi:hypothetical protein
MASTSRPVVSCLLSGTGKHVVCLKRPLSVKVELQNLELFQKFYEHKNDGKFSAVIRAAWALFLRSYTGLEDVVFGFEEIGNLPSIATQKSDADGEIRIPAIFMQLRGDMSFGQLLEHAENLESILTKTSDENYQYNSSVLVRFGIYTTVAGKHQMPSKTHIMSEKVRYLHYSISDICLTLSLV